MSTSPASRSRWASARPTTFISRARSRTRRWFARTVGGGKAMIEMFVNDKLDAAAGVRQPLEDYAKDHPEMRVMSGAFQQIRQAMGTPKGRAAGAKFSRRSSRR